VPQQTYCKLLEEEETPSRNIFFYTTKHYLEYNTMSLNQFNNLMSNMLNQRQALAKLRAELEGREERMCRCCGRFGHLA